MFARTVLALSLSVLPVAVSWAAGSPEMSTAPEAEDHVAEGKKAIKSKDWKTAVTHLKAAAEADPKNADLHNWLGYSYRNGGDYDNAFKSYNQALKLKPDHRGANEYIGKAYLKTKKPEKAEEHLAALNKICGADCEETKALKAAIEAYKAGKPIPWSSPKW